MIDINSLSPAAKDALLTSLLGTAGGEMQSYGENPDEAADKQLIDDQIKGYMEAVMKALEIAGELIQKVDGRVDDLVQGLAGVLDARTRYAIEQDSIAKYGDMFKDFVDPVREIDGSDLMQDLQEAIYELRESPDFGGDEDEMEFVTQAHKALAEKMSRIRGIPLAEAEAMTEESPLDGEMSPEAEGLPSSIEIEKTIVAPKKGPDLESIKRTAERLKASGRTRV